MAAATFERLTSTPTDHQSGLFKVPPELRLNIYETLFARISNIDSSNQQNLPYIAGLLYTNKQLFIEAKPIFLKHATAAGAELGELKVQAKDYYSALTGLRVRIMEEKIRAYKLLCDRKNNFDRMCHVLACVKLGDILSGRFRFLRSFKDRAYSTIEHYEKANVGSSLQEQGDFWNSQLDVMRSGPPTYLNVQSVPWIERSGGHHDSERINSLMDSLALEGWLNYPRPV